MIYRVFVNLIKDFDFPFLVNIFSRYFDELYKPAFLSFLHLSPFF